MNEAFLHHLWKFSLYSKHGLATTDGQEIEVLKAGRHNTDSGPDFFNAQVRIGSTTWAGNVEIHLKSSDWNRHHHTEDAAYNNVVLHVVHEHDQDIFTGTKNKIQTLELNGRYPPAIFQNYLSLVESTRWIPCEGHIRKVDRMVISAWLERMIIERLENKTSLILESLRQNKNNWEETFYHHLARNFGFRTNALPFEMLAKSLPLSIVGKHKDHLLQIESLLFGQAGLLEIKRKDSYPSELKKEYEFLRRKFSLNHMDASQWKFLRLRPSNFPTIRIAQFAQVIHRSTNLFRTLLDSTGNDDLKKIFRVYVSEYWNAHYVFDKKSSEKEKTMGEESVTNLLINTGVPFLFAYGMFRREENFKKKALDCLSRLPPEKNSIIARWDRLGIPSEDATRSQGLLQLKNEYCNRKKCLFCSVGNKIINSIS